MVTRTSKLIDLNIEKGYIFLFNDRLRIGAVLTFFGTGPA
jgi:hypothetical protein